MELAVKVVEKLRDIPDAPGCYMMRDRRGKIIYVGKAISLRKRVQSYFRPATYRNADPKLRGLIKSVDDLDYIVVRNEPEALLTEGRLIKEYKPRYNVSFKDDKRFLLIRVDLSREFPMLKLCRIRKKDKALYFGPYASSPATRVTLDFVERKFGLRKCSPAIPDASTYKHCINDIVRYCSAPCVGKVSREEYIARVEEACAFLKGERLPYMRELRADMEKAASKLEFERAAAIRDTYLALMKTIKEKARVAPTPEMQKEDAKKGMRQLQEILCLQRLPRVIEAFDISNISGTYSVASMVACVDGVPRKNRYRRFKIKTIEGSNDPAMIAEVVFRRYKRLLQEKRALPDLVILDGGITQLKAARAELVKLGLNNLPTAGLAKRYEEIYWQDSGSPLVLDHESQAIKILQRLRDEAHRFALDYHRNIRGKSIRNSVLDDVPGIGKKRKALLLKTFGSVRRIINASEEQIAKVPGIGYEMARSIKEIIV